MITEENFLKKVKNQTKYEGEKHIRLMFNVFNKGEGVMAFCAEALIGKQTFYDWLKAHQEFKKAYDMAISIAGRKWDAMTQLSPDFNFPQWSMIMRNRFGYGKPKVRIAKDATPIARMNAIWDGLEEGELTTQEATQLSSVARTQADILANQKQGTEPFELESKEEIMAKVYAIQKVIDYKNGKL
jgi:hypothetical protein